MPPATGTIALMGSGEMTTTMVEVHKALLRGLGPTPTAVFLDTPAGFQLNVEQISARAVDYFRDRILQSLGVVSLKDVSTAGEFEVQQAVLTLRGAQYLFMGPGSPSYALRQWQQTQVPQVLIERIRDGACLVAASAAALTVGRRTLPVYEIYKVGAALHWLDGMDILGAFDLDLVVVPHWNNAEGGTHDTRFCYMGEPRFFELESMLPPELGVLGIDEHTACVLDFAAGRVKIAGLGGVTYRRGGATRTFSSGEEFPLDALRDSPASRPVSATRPADVAPAAGEPPPADTFWPQVHELENAFQSGLAAADARRAANALLELDRFLWDAQGADTEVQAVTEAREALREMIVLLSVRLDDVPAPAQEVLAPLLDALVTLRGTFRAQQKWAEADALRDLLAAHAVVIEDGPEGSHWRHATEPGSPT